MWSAVVSGTGDRSCCHHLGWSLKAAGRERLPEDTGPWLADPRTSAMGPRELCGSVIGVFPFRPELWSKEIFWVCGKFP